MLMFVGGCASSTGGGMKVIRIIVLCKLIRRGIATRLHPHAVVNIRLNDMTVPSETVTNTANHAFLYLALTLGSTLLISLNGFDLITSFTSVVTCVGNIGPGFNLVGPMGSFSGYSGFSKLILSFSMLLGRLEVFPLLLAVSPSTWRR